MIDKLLPPQFKRVESEADRALYFGLIPAQKDQWPNKFQWMLLEYAKLLASSFKDQGHQVTWAPFKLHNLEGIILKYDDQNGDRFIYIATQADLFASENLVHSEQRRVQKTPRKNKKTKQVSEYARVILEGRFLRLTGLNLGEEYDAHVFQKPDGKPYIVIVPGATMSLSVKDALAQETGEDDADDWIDLKPTKGKP